MKKIYTYLTVAIAAIGFTSCGNITITTPAKDTMHIAALAESVESEAELRTIEKLAAEYEHAYRQCYNGATAMKFKRMVEPILIEAGHRRDEYRAAEEHLAEQQQTLATYIDIMDKAWCLEITSTEDAQTAIAANNTKRDATIARIAELETEKEECSARYFNALDTPEAETLRQEFAKVNDDIESANAEVKAIERENKVIVMAFLLQRGEEIVVEDNTNNPEADNDTEEYDAEE